MSVITSWQRGLGRKQAVCEPSRSYPEGTLLTRGTMGFPVTRWSRSLCTQCEPEASEMSLEDSVESVCSEISVLSCPWELVCSGSPGCPRGLPPAAVGTLTLRTPGSCSLPGCPQLSPGRVEETGVPGPPDTAGALRGVCEDLPPAHHAWPSGHGSPDVRAAFPAPPRLLRPARA